MKKKALLVIIFLSGLVYILWPGLSSVNDFSPLPGSLKSREPGDTFQNLNNAAYFSDYRREFVIDFYKKELEQINIFGIKLPSIRLNHPPEEAFQYIRDQQYGTYLESFNYPLREVLFINGWEPFSQEGVPFYRGITHVVVNGEFFDSKVTIRFYNSNLVSRVFVYLGIWIAFILLYKLTTAVFKEKNN